MTKHDWGIGRVTDLYKLVYEASRLGEGREFNPFAREGLGFGWWLSNYMAEFLETHTPIVEETNTRT